MRLIESRNFRRAEIRSRDVSRARAESMGLSCGPNYVARISDCVSELYQPPSSEQKGRRYSGSQDGSVGINVILSKQ